MYHKNDFWRNAIKALEISNLVYFLYMMNVEFKDG